MQTGSRERIMATRFSRMLFVRRPALVSRRVFIDSLVRLNPLRLVANPVKLIVEITFFILAAMAIYAEGFPGLAGPSLQSLFVDLALIRLLAVWFITVAAAVAASQAKHTPNHLPSL